MNEIIVYRNPVEAFWWQALMSGDTFVYLMYFALVTVGIVGVSWLHSRLTKPRNPWR